METMQRVCVVVGGDFGRSPRMQYHCLSLCDQNIVVDVVAFKGSRPHDNIVNNEHITLHLMNPTPDFHVPNLVAYILKTLWQSVVLLSFLFSLVKPNYILVQNPPSIPILPVVWFYCFLRRVKVIIDWHNYGFSILALSLNQNHILVRICRFVEGYFGSKATGNLCVSKAFQADLKSRWNIDAIVHYDSPADIFSPISIEEKHSLFCKLKSDYLLFRGDTESETRFTRENDGNIVENEERPALIITSTSWTEDEDFSLLIEALKFYDLKSSENSELPELVCVITGKGPLKDHYTEIIRNEKWRKVMFLLPWLEAEQYPKLLAACDLGVCLHTSSSGLDLPMKIVDMFGCGLPLAIKLKD
ncbi:chitobiosyldiphosphodolichol beta-mannosyltransferase-like protein [Leptotrombidium deliense]|uniref:Chitobiosyldiphosphodolichol beta-mannosyltransferase-like protein n=1 Tax=Leptotrombidium deliense TaxID=299467 RepID=A0A443SPK9_9ACAR|nr:chitobiosyldiphosphodolichol beta-mannosyltransferase-like protein [Leptotrombidium deliense]